jgi:hypothetical protein
MLSRRTLTITAGALAIIGFSACKTVYSDTFSYRKNSFKAPVTKEPEIKVPVVPILPEMGAPAGGAVPGAPAPDAGGIPGMPGAAPAAPGIPAVPGAAPAVPGVPPVPGT